MIRTIRIWWLANRQNHAQGKRRYWALVDQRLGEMLAALRGRL